jgi:hypothetical protein
MRLGSDNGDFVEVERAESDADAYDVLLIVRARYHGFTAEVDVWVQRAAWLGFTQDLVILEERRQGEARIEGVSPGELSVVVRSVDRAGHMGVEGMLGSRGYGYSASLQFGVLVFDPSQLPAFVYGARAIAGRLDREPLGPETS